MKNLLHELSSRLDTAEEHREAEDRTIEIIQTDI